MKHIYWLAVLLAASPVAAAAGGQSPAKMNFGVDASYRVDSLDWNIANEATGTVMPNIASELRWRNMKTLQTRLHMDAEQQRVVFRASLAYGTIISGDNEDSDYAGNNRTQEWSRSNNDAGSGNTADFSAGIGYRWPLSAQFSLIPLAGYAWHEQKLTMRNGRQTVSLAATINGTVVSAQPLGPLTGLNSRYKARWHGPWLGADMDWRRKKLTAGLSLRYEWSYYRGEANWNLRTDLQQPLSFLHQARGSGWRIGGHMDYAVSAKWSIGVRGDVSRFTTRAGTDTQFLTTGAVGVTRLNAVTWDSVSVGLGAVYHY